MPRIANWRIVVSAVMACGLCSAARAQTAAQWNFNSRISDLNVVTGTLSASVPTNPSSIQTLGGVVADLESGDSDNGSTDPNSGDDSALQVVNFAGQGTGSGTTGVQFNVSTVGFSNIQIQFDVRHSSTSSKVIQVFYSTDGVSFIAGPQFTANNGGERWYLQRLVNLNAATAANNNPNFKFRVVTVFDPLVGGTTYSGAGGVYDPQGALRFDMVSVSGTPIASIPPSGVATVSPSAVCASGGQLLLKIPVNRGVNPNSSGLAVRADLSTFGGGATQALFDTGTNGDVTPNDRTFSLLYTVPAGQTPGVKTISLTITDAQGRSGTSSVQVEVGDCSQNSPSRVVISQVYGGGGNTPPPASVYNIDFIELCNRSATPVSIDGWTLQYASPVDPLGFFDVNEVAYLSGTIKPGQYYLVRCTIPNSMGAAAPSADLLLHQLIGIGRTGGRVALVRTNSLLNAACSSAEMEDFVGYGGAANCYEGVAPTATPNNDSAVIRKLAGAQDTNQSFNDFVVGTPAPRNRAFGGFLAGYGSVSAPAVCAGADVTLTVNVTAATLPTSTGIQVVADLSSVGGLASYALVDQGGGLFARTYTVPASVIQGLKSIPLLVTDSQGRSDGSSLALTIAQCTASPSSVVISEVYAGGGNSGAIFNADFVELFNRSSLAVDISGWSLQYATADNPAGFDGLHQMSLGGIIGPGQYRLIQASAASTTTGTPIPAPDLLASPGLSMDNEFGRLALVRSAAPLGTNCASASIADLVGYGGLAQCFEGVGGTSKLTNELVARRRASGCQDFNQNLVDFDVAGGAALPHNSLSPANPCVVVSTGACCIGTTCSITTAVACAGSFRGPNTACNFPGNPVTCCKANFDNVNGITVQDIFDYLGAWFAGDARSDFDGNGGVSLQDLFDFLAAWFANCP